MTESSAPKARTSQRVTGKATGGTPAPDGSRRGPRGVRPVDEAVGALQDIATVLQRETPEPGSVAHRLVRDLTAGLALALAIQEQPGIDVTAIRCTPYPFAERDVDVTVAEGKDAEALLDAMRGRGGLGEVTYAQRVLDHYDPPEVHHEWLAPWGGLRVRIGTVLHPDDAAPSDESTETASPEATSDEVSTDPREV